MPEPGVIAINPSGDRCAVPVSLLRAQAGQWPRDGWRVVDGRAAEIETARALGYAIGADIPATVPTRFRRRAHHRAVIAHVIPYTMSVGGAQRFVADLAEYQADYADVHVIVISPTTDEIVTVRDDVSVRHFQGADAALAFIRDLSPTVVHHHYPWDSDVTWRGVAELGIYRIGTHHSWTPHVLSAMPADVIPITGSHPDVIRHGVDVARFAPMRRQRGRKPTVGIVGRISGEKIPREFVRALAAWCDGRDVAVRVVGRGKYGSDLEHIEAELAAIPNVELVGDVPHTDMPGEYRLMDVLLVPSLTDSVSYAAIEAMACGVPVVARNVDGLPLTIGDAGLLRDTDDELLAAVADVLASPSRQRTMSAEGRDRALANHSIGHMRIAYDIEYERRTHGAVRSGTPLDATVLVPVYNTRPDWLQECVDSIVRQAWGKFTHEILIVDDGSTDADTVAELAQIESEHLAHVIRIDHGGVGAALNAGVREALGAIIIRIDSDDRMIDATRCRRQIEAFRDDPALTLIAGQLRMMDDDSATAITFDPARYIGDQGHTINHPTAAFLRQAALNVGGYSTSNAQDMHLWCRLQVGGGKIRVTSDAWAEYRRHKGQDSRVQSAAINADHAAACDLYRPLWAER